MNCSDASSGTTEQTLKQSIKYHDWIPVRSPGLSFYAEEIVSGRPFSLLRYGEGEWRVIHPDMHIKKHNIYSEWKAEVAQNRLRNTLVNYHKHPRYWPAIWHQRYYDKDGRLSKIQRWLKESNLQDIPWHDGRLWRRATERLTFHIVVKALRKAPLPLVFVGPERIKSICKKLPVHDFITIDPTHAYNKLDETMEKILRRVPDEGAIVSFSAGGTANIMIHSLFSQLGESCFLIDFGAVWEGLVGMKTRPYHKPLKQADINRMWK